MRGTIRYRSGAWRLQVYAGTDPATGRERRITRTVRGPDSRAGRKEAERVLAQLVLEVEDDRIPDGHDVTVADLLRRWQTHAAAVKGWSPKTTLEVGRVVDTRLVPAIGDVLVHRLRPATLDELYARLLASGGKDGKPLGPASVRKVHSTIHTALAQAVRWGLIASNPADATTPPTQPATRITPPSPAELTKALAAIDDADLALAAFVRLAAVTGARRSQLVALHWEDLDIDAGTITFARAIVDGGKGVGLVEKGTKSGRTYTVALAPQTLATVDRWRRARREQALACGTPLPGSGYVFSTDPAGARPWRPDDATRRWIRLRRSAGLDDRIRLHDLRHGAATQLIAAGVDVRTVAGRLGHANPNVTLAVYSHFLPEKDQAAANVLDDLLDGTAGP